MALEHITNHNELAKSRLVEQYKDRPLFESLLLAPIAELQKIEDEAWLLYTNKWIDKATGARLDACGKIVGVEKKFAK